jgi:hypothetical protein
MYTPSITVRELKKAPISVAMISKNITGIRGIYCHREIGGASLGKVSMK